MMVVLIIFLFVRVDLLDFKLKWTVIQEYYKKNPQRKFTPRHAIADTYIDY